MKFWQEERGGFHTACSIAYITVSSLCYWLFITSANLVEVVMFLVLLVCVIINQSLSVTLLFL